MKIFDTIETLKAEKQMQKLIDRCDEIMKKEKLTSAEMKRLSEIKITLKEKYGWKE
jgi:hypothetical protein